jgi:hypothetical protein
MTISIPLVFNIPHIVVFIAMVPMMFIVGVGSFMAGKVVSDRSWQADVTHRARQQLVAPWIAPAPADVIYRPNPEIAIFKAYPWRRPEEEELMAA